MKPGELKCWVSVCADPLCYSTRSCLKKAVEAALQARQWTKAVQILSLQDSSISGDYYRQIAEHYCSIQDYQLAEEHFLRAGLIREAMNMYIKADRWEEAYRHAQNCMGQEEIHAMYVGRAQELEELGQLREAEKLYVVVREPDMAISMYKKAKQYDPMTRLVAIYHKDLLDDTHLHLAKVRNPLSFHDNVCVMVVWCVSCRN